MTGRVLQIDSAPNSAILPDKIVLLALFMAAMKASSLYLARRRFIYFTSTSSVMTVVMFVHPFLSLSLYSTSNEHTPHVCLSEGTYISTGLPRV
jgi:hypothetical protein